MESRKTAAQAAACALVGGWLVYSGLTAGGAFSFWLRLSGGALWLVGALALCGAAWRRRRQ